jgi:hypothetical protein
MKQYLLTIYHPGDENAAPSPEVLDKIMRDVAVIREDMKAAGAWIFSGGLQATNTATVLRVQGRDVLKSDGPFAESKEHVGGVTIVQVPDLNAALGWAERLVQAIGTPIEVRPFMEQSGG